MLLGRYLLSTLWLYVRDPVRARAFYRDALGLPLIAEEDGFAHFDAGTVRLSLHPWEGGEPRPVAGSFYVFYVEDGLDDVYDRLTERGVPFSGPPTDEPFGRIAAFSDPEGHAFFLWQPPPDGTPERDAVRHLVAHYETLAARLRTRDPGTAEVPAEDGPQAL